MNLIGVALSKWMFEFVCVGGGGTECAAVPIYIKGALAFTITIKGPQTPKVR